MSDRLQMGEDLRPTSLKERGLSEYPDDVQELAKAAANYICAAAIGWNGKGMARVNSQAVARIVARVIMAERGGR